MLPQKFALPLLKIWFGYGPAIAAHSRCFIFSRSLIVITILIVNVIFVPLYNKALILINVITTYLTVYNFLNFCFCSFIPVPTPIRRCKLHVNFIFILIVKNIVLLFICVVIVHTSHSYIYTLMIVSLLLYILNFFLIENNLYL